MCSWRPLSFFLTSELVLIATISISGCALANTRKISSAKAWPITGTPSKLKTTVLNNSTLAVIPLDVFQARRDQAFWKDMRDVLTGWDEMIVDFNRRTGLLRES